jgi:signal transduction histidine kinase
MLANPSGTRRRIILRLLKIMLPVVLFLAALTAIMTAIHIRTEQAFLQLEGSQALRTEQRFVQTVSRSVVSDLLVLAENLEPGVLAAGRSPTDIQIAAGHFLSFARHKPVYDQIRYLDSRGMEIIRINNPDGNPYIVSPEELQSKQGRYYFKAAKALAAGQIFISPLDLNIEHGEIEQPLKPMIRLATPVVDETGMERGVVVLNFLAQNLLHPLRSSNERQDERFMMLNREGYWLHSSDPSEEFGFMYPELAELTMARRNPGAWSIISRDKEGFFEDDSGYYAFTTVLPAPAEMVASILTSASGDSVVSTDDHYWKLVSFFPREEFQRGIQDFLRRLLVPVLLVLVVFALAAWLLAQAVERRNLAEKALQDANEELEERVTLRTRELVVANEALKAEMREREEAVRARDLAESQLRLTEKMRALGSVAAGIAHDFKNILTPIMAYTDFAREDLPADSPVRESLESIMAAAERASDLVSKILKFSTRQELELSTVSLPELIREVVAQTQAAVPGNVEIHMTVADECPEVTADATQLHQVLTNLCQNAVQALGDAGGVIELKAGVCDRDPMPGFESAEEKPNRICMAVCDNGPGIPPEVREKIFDPYFTTKQDSGGTGLGLATVHGIIVQHGGTIEVTSEPGQGTIFYIRVPVAGPSTVDEVPA